MFPALTTEATERSPISEITQVEGTGEGTTDPQKLEQPQAKSNQASKTMGAGELILLADDEKVILDLGCRILRSRGYRVLAAHNGEEAVELYRQYQDGIDLVILDAMMPKLTGVEACHQIEQMNPAVRIILATGYDLDDVTEGVTKSHHIRFLQKPYTAQQLLAVLREMLDDL